MILGCLLLVIGGSHAGTGPECEEREEQEIQSRVSGCLASVTFQFEDARDAAGEVLDVREAVCLLVAQAVDDCCGLWKECHSGEEVKIHFLAVQTPDSRVCGQLNWLHCHSLSHF